MNALNDYVMIEPINRNELANEAINIKGFTLDIKNQAEPQIGYIRFMSKEIVKPEYTVGDKVIFNEPHPEGIKVEGVSYIPVKHEKIIAKIKD